MHFRVSGSVKTLPRNGRETISPMFSVIYLQKLMLGPFWSGGKIRVGKLRIMELQEPNFRRRP
ncbi:MAG: hypothetical protein Q4C70_13685 [Planctomycetia bacterium]|nr:hypothetical protein [Planctomycetia bacterium]